MDVVTPSATPDIVNLKEQINAQRRKIYQQLAGEKGVPVEEVAALAAEKTISQRLKPGMFYMNSSASGFRSNRSVSRWPPCPAPSPQPRTC